MVAIAPSRFIKWPHCLCGGLPEGVQAHLQPWENQDPTSPADGAPDRIGLPENREQGWPPDAGTGLDHCLLEARHSEASRAAPP